MTKKFYIRKFLLEVTWDRDFFYPIDSFARRFFLERYRSVFSPVLERRFRKEDRKDTVLLDHRMVSEQPSIPFTE
jgi:hypothetical protein